LVSTIENAELYGVPSKLLCRIKATTGMPRTPAKCIVDVSTEITKSHKEITAGS
jgi:hypothetical protein